MATRRRSKRPRPTCSDPTKPKRSGQPALASSAGEQSSGARAAPSEELDEALVADLLGPVFGLPFFCTVLRSRLHQHCPGVTPDVPQVLLHLAGGVVLDLCHIVELSPRWIAAAVFRDARSCEEMDLEFVPYELIVRVTLSRRPADERRIGFDAERSTAAIAVALPHCRTPS